MDNFDQQSSVNMQGLNRFLSRMYGYMAGAIAISAIMAFITVKYLQYTIFSRWCSHCHIILTGRRLQVS
ncbi:hypothetical protein [Ligilactobacillus aviarius]|uniref:hypothetical protein n=1 Tax=Ligilactobacillus aviarius TaxID=1606 RepID=UPI0032E9C49C